MRTIKRLLLFALPALLLAGCNNEDFNEEPGGQTGTNGDITFEIGFTPQTRVSTGADFKSAWETGDEIGVFAVRRASTGTGSLSATASDNYINNVKLTYNGTSWTAATALYYPAGTDVLDFYAYYPYDDNGGSPATLDPTAIAFNVKADQGGTTSINSADRSNYNLSDLLTAKSDNAGSGFNKSGASTPIPLIFSHALAMVQVSVPSPGKGFGPGPDLKVTLRGVKPGATLNLNAISTTAGSEITLAAADNDAVNIKMYRVEQSGDTDYETAYTYRALVPAQGVAQGEKLFSFEQEGALYGDVALAGALTLASGEAEAFTRSLPATAIHTVAIPAGTFQMGSPTTELNRQSNETQHLVTLTKDFRMSKYPVTFAQYDAFCEATGHTKPDDSGWGRGDRPVINVSWNDAVAYCAWLTQTTGITYSLPTEAQWEYACRGDYANKATETNTLPFGIGGGTKLTHDMANFWTRYPYDVAQGGQYDDNASTGYVGKTTEVGAYPYANGYGLYDMHGNVFEWCADWYGTYGSGPDTDPVGPDTGSSRVLRGGYWSDIAQNCRSAYRFSAGPGYASYYVGFRVAFVP